MWKRYIPATDTSPSVCIWPKLDHLSRLCAIPRNYKRDLDNEKQQLVRPAHQQRAQCSSKGFLEAEMEAHCLRARSASIISSLPSLQSFPPSSSVGTTGPDSQLRPRQPERLQSLWKLVFLIICLNKEVLHDHSIQQNNKEYIMELNNFCPHCFLHFSPP